MKRSGLIAMVVLTALPLFMAGLAVAFVLPDVIPLHAGPGGIDRVGSKYGAFDLTFALVAVGSLLTVLYAFMDKLAAKYDTDAQSGRVLLLFAAALMNVWQLVFLLWMSQGVK
ncbi:SdpI family protein [Arabiibacter massiliensis]|uniref:hypothetical protein n=1 Tax=Arabiibacter massiliensis TaxID=1870985 RepID=UPI0009BA9B5A|nr:hypothetical protein [Arabiibacter massiliensis]